jgi:hypothetical protein
VRERLSERPGIKLAISAKDPFAARALGDEFSHWVLEMKSYIALAVGLLAAALLAASSAKADGIFFTATLLSTNEVPPQATPATSFVTLTFTANSLTVVETFSDLTTPATADLLHCCAGPTANTGAALPFIGFPAATSGTYNNTFDLTAAGTYTAFFINNNGGTAAGAEAALLAGMDAGLAYVNIHDSTFPGGEIRGQLALVSTPEPSTMVLIGTGLLTLVGTVLRRREQR